ncbi:MAG: undecaprenyl-diphosphate phosphatase [Candidatus Omnitrophica bacterium]|nr:undecaprenyl-diphosphate phosphatase [Candidatus Omnitrophota bacterium]
MQRVRSRLRSAAFALLDARVFCDSISEKNTFEERTENEAASHVAVSIANNQTIRLGSYSMNLFDSCLLGFLQGLTEFLPISSSGHLVMMETWMNYTASNFLGFDLLLHLATLLAVCAFYRRRLLELGSSLLPAQAESASKERWEHQKLILALLLSTGVTVVIGLLFLEFFERVRDNLAAVGFSFLITSGLLLSTLRAHPAGHDNPASLPANLWRFALIMGVMQSLAILPGVSRSGATISVALLLGVSKTRAVEYSFLMSIPAIILASVYQFLFKEVQMGQVSFLPALAGFLISLFSGLLFLWLLLWIVKKGRLYQFAFYTLPLGLGMLGYIVLAA